MKIDLHCHTKAIKKGDGRGRNVTPELFKTKIENSDVKIVAITNHNAFDLEQYKSLAAVVVNTCQVWPGVEIDVLESGSKRWHLIVVVNPKEASDFSASVDNLFMGDNLNDCTHTLDEIYAAFKNHDAIYIAHFHQKKPAIPLEDAEKLDEIIQDPHRVFKETANESSMSVFVNYRYNVLVGSDVKDWNHYEDCSFSELKLPVDSFEQFCLLSKRDETVVQTLLNKKDSKNLIAHPAVGVDLPIRIYADMNVIFGQKGTGKTEIVSSLFESMRANGYKCVRYVASERDDDFKALLRISGIEPELSVMGVRDCENEFDDIGSWVDASPTHFNNYLNWKKTDGNNANKSRMRITRASALPSIENVKEELHKADKETIDNVFLSLLNIQLEEYLSQEESDQLRALLRRLKESIYQHRFEDLISEQVIHLVNYTLNTIKEIADKSTNSVSKPSTTGLTGFVEGRLKLLKIVNTILRALSVDESNSREKVGTLDEKGDIYINTKFRMLCAESRKEEFRIGIRKLRVVKAILEYIKQNIFNVDIADQVQNLNDICSEDNITSVLPFIGKSKQIINNTGELYSPSNGEKGMLLLQRAIMEEADAYFLDEPELGMGNSYIDTTIRPILVNLSKRHKYVVVATHNANIGVRTLPYTSIYRTHSNGIYTTYIGNPFSDRLVNINDENDVLNWAEESLNSLEGSRDAFYERKDIYESNNS